MSVFLGGTEVAGTIEQTPTACSYAMSESAKWAKRAIWAGFALLTFAGSASAQEDRSWHLLTQTRGGTVSVVGHLTQHECDVSRLHLLNQPATDEEKETARQASEKMFAAANQQCATSGSDAYVHCKDGKASSIVTQMGTVDPGDIKSAECFQ